MKVFVKSAGRRETQDYVWMCLDGRPAPADHVALSLAERSAAKRGRVASFVAQMEGDAVIAALFFGNVDSGRSDFYGTPILNRLGIVFDFSDSQEVRAALALATDWHSERSVLESLLRNCIGAADVPVGFGVDGSFRDMVAECASSGPRGRLRQDADLALFDSIRAAGRLSRQTEISSRADVSATAPSSVTTPEPRLSAANPAPSSNSSMKIFVNTVPSGSPDYGWYVGGRPDYADRLWKICDPVRSISAGNAYFAALARESGKWILFLQDVVGRDNDSNRPARFTFAIEIPDSDSHAQDKARRLLVAWLHPLSLLPTLTQFIDISGTEVVADEAKLLAAAKDVATAEVQWLEDGPSPASRTWLRISRNRSNRDELRDRAWRFVAEHKFPTARGVHFLFTNAPYSCNSSSADALPDIPAKFVVTGFRDGEPDVVGTDRDSGPGDAEGSRGGPVAPVPNPRPGTSTSGGRFPLGKIGIAAAVSAAFVVVAARGCGQGQDKAKGVVPDNQNSPVATNAAPATVNP